MPLHEKHLEWIEARGIDGELAVMLGLTTRHDERGYWLSVPYIERERTVNHKHRLTQQKRFEMDPNAPLVLWNHDVLLDQRVQSGQQAVLITEGEFDALAAMTSGFHFAVSVPNGTSAQADADMSDPEVKGFQYLWRSRDLLDRVGTFILSTDGDEPGRALAANLVRWFGPERCKFISYPEGCKDLNDVLLTHGQAKVAALIDTAKPYPVRDLYTIDDFPEPPTLEPMSTGIPVLGDMLPIVPGTFTVGTGYAGQGKTSLMVKIIANLLRRQVTVALGSFETQVKPILQRKLRAAICETAEFTCPRDLADDADELIRRHLRIIAQQADDDEADMTLDDMLELARVAILRDDAKVIIIDPWNELEHKRQPGESETDYTSRAIRQMKRFARRYDVALWVIAHPAKPQLDRGKLPIPGLYSISGSAHWANKPDYGFVVHRPKRDTDLVDVHVTKVRMGLPGKMGKVTLSWNWRASRYLEWVDELDPDRTIAAA